MNHNDLTVQDLKAAIGHRYTALGFGGFGGFGDRYQNRLAWMTQTEYRQTYVQERIKAGIKVSIPEIPEVRNPAAAVGEKDYRRAEGKEGSKRRE